MAGVLTVNYCFLLSLINFKNFINRYKDGIEIINDRITSEEIVAENHKPENSDSN